MGQATQTFILYTFQPPFRTTNYRNYKSDIITENIHSIFSATTNRESHRQTLPRVTADRHTSVVGHQVCEVQMIGWTVQTGSENYLLVKPMTARTGFSVTVSHQNLLR